ncbi:hypothetical protein PV10_09232 [Exophiala mesophila]|uniref:ABM domain-containing protein n=1 Tax=Exophiala mesophila TaxID=212818 RepID=A0A0D1Z237_EXOME|nr:uncharacterized protein PV10_09232 [Exophiala mesophila]KIV87954.1 hypothetical protein PV10_09232 [Exophiala mesophila]
MFEVIFEVQPRTDQWESYLATGKALRPELESTRGFIANIRYRSLRRPGWILSLSDWENEKALVRWRTASKHHLAQATGRDQILRDYHLRVGEVSLDSDAKRAAQGMVQTRFDGTEVGNAKVVSLVNARMTPLDDGGPIREADDVVRTLQVELSEAPGLVEWDTFEAILTPGDVLLMCSWKDQTSAAGFNRSLTGTAAHRTRQVRVIRDYGMYDRREAPQYYPEVEPR